MFDPNFYRTSTERTDVYRQVIYDDSPEHEERIKALCAKTQTDYFDTGLHSKETHLTERIDEV